MDGVQSQDFELSIQNSSPGVLPQGRGWVTGLAPLGAPAGRRIPADPFQPGLQHAHPSRAGAPPGQMWKNLSVTFISGGKPLFGWLRCVYKLVFWYGLDLQLSRRCGSPERKQAPQRSSPQRRGEARARDAA